MAKTNSYKKQNKRKCVRNKYIAYESFQPVKEVIKDGSDDGYGK